MKTLFILLLFVLPLYTFAQTDTTRHRQKNEYCMVTVEVWGTHREIIVDHGQAMNKHRDEKLKDASGKVVKFTSNPEILNYMDRYGWELVASDFFGSENKIGGDSGKVIYTFKRPLL